MWEAAVVEVTSKNLLSFFRTSTSEAWADQQGIPITQPHCQKSTLQLPAAKLPQEIQRAKTAAKLHGPTVQLMSTMVAILLIHPPEVLTSPTKPPLRLCSGLYML